MDTFVFIILPILLGICLAIGVLCCGIGYLVRQSNKRTELRVREALAMMPYTRELVSIMNELTVGIDSGSIAIPNDFDLRQRIESACYRAPKGLK